MKKYFWKNRIIIVSGIVICLIQLTFGVFAQIYKGQVLDRAIERHDDLLKSLLILILFSAGSVLIGFLYMLCRSRLAQKIVKMLRDDLFSSLLRRDYQDFSQLDQGEVLAKYTKQIGTIEHEFLFMLTWLFEMLLKIGFVIVTLTVLHPLLGLFSVVIFAVPIFLPKLAEKKLTRVSAGRLDKMENHLAKFNAWLKGFELIKNYGIEKEIAENYKMSNRNLRNSELQAEKTFAQTTGWGFLGTLGAQACLVIIAGTMVFRQTLTAGDFVAVIGLVGMLQAPIYWVAKLIQTIISTKPARESVLGFIAYERPGKRTGCRIDNQQAPAIDLRHIVFGYDEKLLLNDLNIQFEAGKRYLVTGESGCGKSTIVNLLLGYLTVDSGDLLIDDQPVRSIDNLSDLFTVVRQDAILFDDTVRNNVTLLDDTICQDRIVQVLQTLGLERLADEVGLETKISAGGANFSGGEKKRLSLARALLRDTPVLVLDEPLANIDAANVSQIEDILLGIQGKTVIIISHQFTREKLKHFDAVYKIEGGVCHDTLLA